MLRLCITWLCLAVFLSGCGQKSADEVVARVNGHVLTATEVSRRAEMMASLTVHRTGKTNDAVRIRKTYQKGYAAFWAEGRVLSDYAKSKGIEIPEKTLEMHRQAAFRNFKTKKDKDYSQLMAAAIKPADRDLWESQVRDEVLRTVLKKHFAEQYPTNFGDAYAVAEIAKMQAHNARMALTNAVQYAKATNAWQRICRGEDFVKVGKETTELEDERDDDCDWLIVDDKYLADEPVLTAALAKMKIGDVSPPLEADNGLMIMRLDRIEGDGAKSLSRIFFHLPRFLTPAPKEEIIKCAEADYAADLYRRKVAELVAAAKVEYFKQQNAKGK